MITTNQKNHAVRIKSPFYQNDGNCGLHRYLEADFVNRFKQNVTKHQFDLPQFSSWQQEEQRSQFDDALVLRLPLHRAFHIVSCEVVCDCLGEPALDPDKVASAGFVIRRINSAGEQAWILEDGEAMGWQGASVEQGDPDRERRLCANGVLHQSDDQATYSGEEVHPLHALKIKDATNKTHTLLFGYLPLGGFYYQRDTSEILDQDDQKNVATSTLLWPFGYRQSNGQLWSDEHTKPVVEGKPTEAFFELLRVLVNRYHLGENSIEENAELEALCRQIGLYDAKGLALNLGNGVYNETNQALFTPYRKQTLYDYLQACFANASYNPLVDWIDRQETSIREAHLACTPVQLELLPRSDDTGKIDSTVLILASQARYMRYLLGQRLLNMTLDKIKEIPLPKFAQNNEDVFQVRVFIRYRDNLGQERLHWADTTRSISFRVAAPFDPEASRPAMIQMPSLADLRRGLAKGVSMITPSDTFSFINSLKSKEGASADALPKGNKPKATPDTGIQWICSFSLPVITMVAMILLMIMISLLNFIFSWIPWVRICLPVPKLKFPKGGG